MVRNLNDLEQLCLINAFLDRVISQQIEQNRTQLIVRDGNTPTKCVYCYRLFALELRSNLEGFYPDHDFCSYRCESKFDLRIMEGRAIINEYKMSKMR